MLFPKDIVKRIAERYLRDRRAATLCVVHYRGNELDIFCLNPSRRFRRKMCGGGLADGLRNRLDKTCKAMAGQFPGFSIGVIKQGSVQLFSMRAQKDRGYQEY